MHSYFILCQVILQTYFASVTHPVTKENSVKQRWTSARTSLAPRAVTKMQQIPKTPVYRVQKVFTKSCRIQNKIVQVISKLKPFVLNLVKYIG